MYTQEQYVALTSAIAQGALIVEYGDKKVEYRSLKEMLQIQGLMEADLGININKTRRRYASFSKGLQ